MTDPSVEKNLLKEFDSLITPDTPENPVPNYDAYATWNETDVPVSPTPIIVSSTSNHRERIIDNLFPS
ncbi:8930_t:CDS:2 [Ambispora gerdemannii]|uniref:8930_t:CDS:1 n=1 Tax=Ambispora gerdemannii TaxID=144530 RepID=A0A9N8YPE7_9GLOM|nr:8930_t:CDS:2 [Ambispora gerdemannii]